MYQAICYITDATGDTTLISSDLIVSARYTLNQGVGPSACIVRMLPQTDFGVGECNIVFTDGTTTIILPNCKLDTMQLDDSQGTIWELTFLDRRWKWQLGQIDGRYNLYNPDQSLNTVTEQSPQQLATLCLEMMGETAYEVANLPDAARPLADWDFANPAEVLEDLAESLGCRVVLHLDNSVSLEVVGSGTPPALSADTLAESLAAAPAEMPDEIAVVGAPIRFQVDLPLRAVGIDIDGSVQPIDDLSYIPYGDGEGWGASDILTFSDLSVSDDLQYEGCRQKAIESVYRWYQVDPTATIKIPNPNDDGEEGENDDDPSEPDPSVPTITLTSIDQILPLAREQLMTVEQSMFGEVTSVALPAWVYGMFTTEPLTRLPKNNVESVTWINPESDGYDNDPQIYRGGWSLDTEHGIVKFAEQVYAYQTEDTFLRQPAKLYLRTSFVYRPAGNSQASRHVYNQSTGSDYGTQPLFEVREELQRQIIALQDGGDFDVSGVTDNVAEINTAANDYYDAILAGYATTAQQQIPFRDLQPIDCSGIVWQVSWSVDRDGPTMTHVSVNADHLRGSQPYGQLRRDRKVDALLKKLARAPAAQAVDYSPKG